MHIAEESPKLNFRLPRQTPIFFLCLIIAVLFCGCAQFHQAGTRWVKHPPIKDGPISEELDSYRLVKVLSFPTQDSPQLKLCQEKTVKIKIQYTITSHEEQILKRTPTPVEKSFEKTGNAFEKNLVSGVFSLAFLPLDILFGHTPGEEIKYERIPQSERTELDYKYETKAVPAVGEVFKAPEIGIVITDANGIVEFRVSPERFDKGQYIYHEASGKNYLVQREKLTRNYKAPWYAEAKIGALVTSAGYAIRHIQNVIAVGGGPAAVAGAIIIHAAFEIAIGYIIDIVATRTEEYYQWIIVQK